jgi:hypothetical protein
MCVCVYACVVPHRITGHRPQDSFRLCYLVLGEKTGTQVGKLGLLVAVAARLVIGLVSIPVLRTYNYTRRLGPGFQWMAGLGWGGWAGWLAG